MFFDHRFGFHLPSLLSVRLPLPHPPLVDRELSQTSVRVCLRIQRSSRKRGRTQARFRALRLSFPLARSPDLSSGGRGKRETKTMPEVEEPAATPSSAAAAPTAPPPTTAADSDSKKKKEKRAWLPLESNPLVLSSYARALGAPPSTSFADVYGLDDELLGMVPTPVLALLLLFPITKSYEDTRIEQEKELRRKKKEEEEGEQDKDRGGSSSPPLPYFTRQTIGNACGTVGLIHSFASIRDKVFEGGEDSQRVFAPGSFLERFYEATAAMTPDERAAFLEADDEAEEEEGGGTQTQKISIGEGGGGGMDEEEARKKKKDRETRAALAASIDAAHAAGEI